MISWHVWGRFADVKSPKWDWILQSVRRFWVFRWRFTVDNHPPVLHLYHVLNDGTTAVSLGEWELAQSGRYISSPATMQLLPTRIRIGCHYKGETSHYVTPNVCYFPLHNSVQRTVMFITLGTASAWPLAVVFWLPASCCLVYRGKFCCNNNNNCIYLCFFTVWGFVPITSFTLLFSCDVVSISPV